MNVSNIFSLGLVYCLLIQSRLASTDFIELKSLGYSGFNVSVEYGGLQLQYHLRELEEGNSFEVWESNDISEIKISSERLRILEDEVSGSSLVLQISEDGLHSLQGTLGEDFVLQPAKVQADLENTSQLIPSMLCPECLPLALHTILNQVPAPAVEDPGDYTELEDFDPKDFSSRRGRNIPFAVYPEILVLADYELYKKNDYNIQKTKNYVASFMNGVNLRFRSLYSPSVSLHISGIIVGTSSGSFSFMGRSILSGSRLESNKALHDMGVYFYNSESLYPQYDMVLLLTGLDMARERFGVMSSSTSGYAYVGGACVKNVRLGKISSVAIVEDTGGYSGMIVAAHEIGHLLGSVHDGDYSPSYLSGPGASGCPWTGGYIMSDRRQSTRGMQWSDCSIKQIRFFLGTPAAQCLQNKPRSVEYFLDEDNPPGAAVSLDYQCFKDKGTRACFKNQNVCTQLFCYQPNSRSCLSYRPAAEGSECGPGAWCRNAKCVSKPINIVKNSFDVELRGSFRDRIDTPSTSSFTPQIQNNFQTSNIKTTNYFQNNNFQNNIQPTTRTFYIQSTTPVYTTTYYNQASSFSNPKTTIFNTNTLPVITTSSRKTPYSIVTRNYGSTRTTISSTLNFGATRSTRNVIDTACEDDEKLQGSLSCTALFERYAFHYCARNKVVKKKCCKSYHLHCKD